MPKQKPAADERVTKRKVVLTSVTTTGTDSEGRPVILTQQAVDYWDAARPGLIDALKQAALAAGWQSVEVGAEPDAGPGGYHGQTHVPASLAVNTPQLDGAGNLLGYTTAEVPVQHQLAGATFPATKEQ